MTGTMRDRPVGISHTQFEFAQKKGDAFWLYVVEQASDPDKALVLRIQDPVAYTKTYRFDYGWKNIAKTEM